MIKILHIADEKNITGCLITLFDLHLNLLNYNIEHSFDIYIKSYNICRKYYTFINKCVCVPLAQNVKFKPIYDNNLVTSDIIITTTEHLSSCCYTEGITNNFQFHLDCNHLIFLDTLGLWIGDMAGKMDLFRKYIQDYNTTLLSSPFNLKYDIFSNSEEYYHKFSEVRINYLKDHFVPGIYSDYYSTEKYGDMKNSQIYPASDDEKTAHNYAGYLYERWFKRKNIYAENIGKMIYENVLLGKYTHYSSKNKCIDDGLTYYFKYLNLDDSIDQELGDFARQNILNKLFMKEDDLLLKMLK